MIININSIDTYFKNERIASQEENTEKNIETDDLSSYKEYFDSLPTVANSDSNSLTDLKIDLGKRLYFDSRLSKDGNNSCNSCHNLETFGVDNLSFSPGDLGENGGRNSPTTFNAALHFLQFWDGRAKDVEEQAGGPILNPIEMNIPSKEFLIERLGKIPVYVEHFKKAYPEEENSLTYFNIQKSIAAFERTLITPSSFDQFIKGNDEALSKEQIEGLKTFIDVGCTQCHNGALLGGTSFQKFGVHTDYWLSLIHI